ncbi:hypothetical protein PG990_001591 [Apiospora arundinis]|uniref:Uncharacterized protein n=1 Tax=Apiospora arundinis TaxID=335852 RepID=A0ABR2HSC2_9PEZI
MNTGRLPPLRVTAPRHKPSRRFRPYLRPLDIERAQRAAEHAARVSLLLEECRQLQCRLDRIQQLLTDSVRYNTPVYCKDEHTVTYTSE